MRKTDPALIPLQQLPPGAWAGVTGVFTDIDDTLTRDGAIEPQALQALHDLRRAGFTVIAGPFYKKYAVVPEKYFHSL